jgi:hypothetical protein
MASVSAVWICRSGHAGAKAVWDDPDQPMLDGGDGDQSPAGFPCNQIVPGSRHSGTSSPIWAGWVARVSVSIHRPRTPLILLVSNDATGLPSLQQAQGGPVGECSVTSRCPNGAWSAIQHAGLDARSPRRRTNDEEKQDRRRGWCHRGGNDPWRHRWRLRLPRRETRSL